MVSNPSDIEDIKRAISAGHIFGEIGVFNDNGDKAECHICGKWYVSVASHAWQIHGIIATEYRELFSLNYSQGLEADKERRGRKERGRREYRLGISVIKSKPANAAIFDKIRGRPQRFQSVLANIKVHPAEYIELHCVVCGKYFIKTLTEKRLTCSNECRKKRRVEVSSGNKFSSVYWDKATSQQKKARSLKISITRRLKYPRAIKVCAICGNAYDVIPSHAHKRATCGKIECTREYKHRVMIGKKHTEGAKIKMSQLAIERHQREGNLFGGGWRKREQEKYLP